MPGRTPAEAVEAFAEPLQRAVACIGSGKLVFSPHSKAPDDVHMWSLNGAAGMGVHGWHIEAQMHYVVHRDAEHGWRVHTRAYRYRIAALNHDVALLHWHPFGMSDYALPHAHLRVPAPGDVTGTAPLRGHFPTGRITFEEAIEWAITYGMPPAREDWREVLLACRQPHIEHRTWDYLPPGVKEPVAGEIPPH